ncbi:hypothetical protein NBRGN_101_00070 [Nocardia brasiliensis NBRC 14402]|uniref:UbiA family prenyltransferase n=1 Tax=Nocardia brasiliensis TaxID=37326 RepID=UPI00045C740C|nr:UbiA family prenyltransferase [Nocardia brasiliensis]ASF12196.1 hypothetical protein CEQ30_38075 [Nocardia brasiliensis]GAJ85891.1 hypothetical protein NBRGN_101_00070 [Nocardia brasiliensis NBRC 14402]SUB53116.1 prenyltransferase [Nocardia brasiliensis]
MAQNVSPAQRGLAAEIKLSSRLVIDNAVAAFVPGPLFTAAACAHYMVRDTTLIALIAVSAVVFFLYHYVFDTSNQATAGPEDDANKPYRPIPAGLATPQGLMRRFWVAMALYTALGAVSGILIWVLLWQVTVIGLNLFARPRDYLWTKPIAMCIGTFAQLAAAWQLVGPIDSTGWWWILTLTIAFNLPLRFEDVRDMEGDRRAGRKTLPLLIGHWPVRIWFTIIMSLIPLALHRLLFAPSPAGPGLVMICDIAVAAVAWTAATLAVSVRNSKVDRISYLLHNTTYVAAIGCGAVLL